MGERCCCGKTKTSSRDVCDTTGSGDDGGDCEEVVKLECLFYSLLPGEAVGDGRAGDEKQRMIEEALSTWSMGVRRGHFFS